MIDTVLGKWEKKKGVAGYTYREDLSRRFHRWIATQLLKVVKNIPYITPNIVTLIGFGLACLSGLIYASAGKDVPLLVLGAFFYFLVNIFDMLDGQLAREKDMASAFGHWFDVVLGDLGKLPLIIGMGLSCQDSEGNFTLKIGDYSVTNSIWLLIFLAWNGLIFLEFQCTLDLAYLKEPALHSSNDVYFLLIISLLNLVLWGLVLMVIVNHFLVVSKILFYWRQHKRSMSNEN